MKKFILLTFTFLLTGMLAFSQTVEFSDDFESGTSNWVLTGAWGTTTTQSNSPTHSLTDSPAGNYLANQNITATMAAGVDLSAVLDAEVKFWAIYDIEGGNFDYCYVEASGDGGVTWINVATFLGEDNLSPWEEYTYSLGGFVGNSDVRVRFRLFTDGGYEVDGIYIDDFSIESSNDDNSAPLILHNPPQFYESNIGAITMVADLIDVSGISSADLKYTVDGGAEQSVTGVNVSSNTWSFVIPAQAAGAQVDYHLDVTDNSPNLNNVTSDTYAYIAGHHIFYDNSQVDFVNSFGPAAASGLLGCAVRITLNGTADVVYALIRNYTDINRPNNDFLFHVWENNGGLPGTDMITPFLVTPEANLVVTSPMTRIDLSAYSAELSGLTGDFFIGYTVPVGQTWLVQTTPGVGGRTYEFNGTTWALSTDDYHFRVVTTQFSTPDDCDDAADLTSMLGQGIDNPQTSPLWDNSDATIAGTEPVDGFDCWFDESIDNPIWFTFVGDGGSYQITTNDCNGTATDYIQDGDAQIAIYSGDDCGNLTPAACNDDGEVAPDVYAPIVEIETTAGVTYFMMIDGYDGAEGEFCIEITELSVIACEDISIGTSSGEANVCFNATTSFTIDGVVIPTSPLSGFNWTVSSADISGSGDPYNETSLLGTFGLSSTPYGPALVNDGTQLPAGTYFFTPVAFGGAIDTDGTFAGLDFSNGCVETGVSIEVTLYPELDDLAGTPASTEETIPPGNNGEASVAVTGGSGSYSYNWNNGGTTQTITGIAGGDYTVTISDDSGCVDDLVVTVTVEVITGTGDLEFEQAIQLYPNPAKSLTSLVYNFNETVNLKMTMTNAVGQIVEQRIIDNAVNGNIEISLDKFAEGVYFIQLTDGTHISSRRLVVSK